jgi:hypothetical protein
MLSQPSFILTVDGHPFTLKASTENRCNVLRVDHEDEDTAYGAFVARVTHKCVLVRCLSARLGGCESAWELRCAV